MPKLAANLSMLFTELPFLERFGAAAEFGFKGVEYLFPYSFDVIAIREELDKHGLKQVLFNLPAGDWDAGDRGMLLTLRVLRSFVWACPLPSNMPGLLDASRLTAWQGLYRMESVSMTQRQHW